MKYAKIEISSFAFIFHKNFYFSLKFSTLWSFILKTENMKLGFYTKYHLNKKLNNPQNGDLVFLTGFCSTKYLSFHLLTPQPSPPSLVPVYNILVINALLHKGISKQYLSRYNSSVINVNTDTSS